MASVCVSIRGGGVASLCVRVCVSIIIKEVWPNTSKLTLLSNLESHCTVWQHLVDYTETKLKLTLSFALNLIL